MVVGSSPIGTAKKGELAQLARALAWHARGHRFDSGILHQIGPIAQMARASALHAGGREFESHWVHNSAPVAKLVDATGLSPVSH
jgi:hypothetical protein